MLEAWSPKLAQAGNNKNMSENIDVNRDIASPFLFKEPQP
ncbi:hypothetical protein COMA2_110120 [Candidatus Nitrospira nitrificans]|uniref:Uncharacterized protein n=1 Tax=Candidatus Nitrospira nitrificans TaxID=1742973 RepID=A0A0S4LAH0_9BACT|nr:hypothetical protein COMA2_110120 [Candidatus Nitrospira nitrificans]